MQTDSFIIDATSLRKCFKQKIAVDAVSIRVAKGQIFGLLGPNAAGKTTIIRLLCGIVETDAGEIRINKMSVDRAKGYFGYVAQHFGQYEELTVWENLKFYAQMYGVQNESRLHTLIQHYALMPYKDLRAGSLSGGYQRRLALVCALAHDPDVLFLDEPTAGIDPVTRKLLWDDFYALSAQGKTLFVTTHYMEEAQRCHQLAFIDSGRIIAEGTPVTIKQALGDVNVFSCQLSYQPELHQVLLAQADILLVNQFGSELRIVTRPEVLLSWLETLITNVAATPVTLLVDNLNLEDVFIALTQHRERKQ